jgi:hypothetical protein
MTPAQVSDAVADFLERTARLMAHERRRRIAEQLDEAAQRFERALDRLIPTPTQKAS